MTKREPSHPTTPIPDLWHRIELLTADLEAERLHAAEAVAAERARLAPLVEDAVLTAAHIGLYFPALCLAFGIPDPFLALLGETP